MSRMFHRTFAASVLCAAAMAVPVTAMAADSGGGGGSATPTSVAVHLPAHVRAGEPVTVSARIIPQEAAQEPGTGMRPGGHRGTGHGDTGHSGTGHSGTKSGGKSGKAGKGTAKGGHKGTGHGTGRGKGKGGAGHRAVTGEVRFFLDGKAEPPVEVSRDQASEKLRIPLGRHTLVAEYSGDADYLAARSAPVSFELAPGQVGDPGQDEGTDQDQNQDQNQGVDGQGSDDGLGQSLPDAPGQGTDQYGPGQDEQDPSGQDQSGQDQGGRDSGDLGTGQSTPDQGPIQV